MRPSSKYILTNHSVDAAQKSETVTNNTRVQALMRAGHSCLNCSYFPAPTKPIDVLTCKHTHWIPKKKVRHYNICHLHATGKIKGVNTL